jgi:hypothetical protein
MILKTNNLLIQICLALLLAVPARAQVTAPREAAQIQLGPLAVYPSLQIVDAGIDENVFNDGSSPQRDYTMTVSSRVLSVVRLGSNELMFQTGNDYVWFREFSAERSSNAQYAMRFNLSASRFKPFIGAERQRTRSRQGPEIDARARRIDGAVLGGLGFDLTPRTHISASVRFDESNYEEGERFRDVALDEALNRSGRGANAGVRYAITPLTTMSVTAGYEEQAFVHSHVRDVTRYTLGPSVEFSPEAAIRGRVAAAFELFEPADPSLEARTGVAFHALLNWSIKGRTMFDLGAGRNISYSYQDTDPYYLLTNVRLTVSQPLAWRFELYGGGSRDHMAYSWHRGALGPSGESDRVDTMTSATGGVGIQLPRGFQFRAGIEKTRRRSVEDPRQDFTRTRLLSTVTIGS